MSWLFGKKSGSKTEAAVNQKSEEALEQITNANVLEWTEKDVNNLLVALGIENLGVVAKQRKSNVFSSGKQLLATFATEIDIIKTLGDEEEEEEEDSDDDWEEGNEEQAKKIILKAVPIGYVRTLWLTLSGIKAHDNKLDPKLLEFAVHRPEKAQAATTATSTSALKMNLFKSSAEMKVELKAEQLKVLLSRDVRTLNPEELAIILRDSGLSEVHVQKIAVIEQVNGEAFVSFSESDLMKYFNLSQIDSSSSSLARLISLIAEIKANKYKYVQNKKASKTGFPTVPKSEAMERVKRKILASSKMARTFNEEDLEEYARNLCTPEGIKEAYLNKNFNGIKNMFNMLNKTTQKNILPSSTSGSAEEVPLDDISYDPQAIEEEQKNFEQASHKRLKEKVKVKLVIAEIAKSSNEKTLRKLLSPVISELNINPQFGWFHSAIIIGPWYLEWNSSSLIIPRRCYSSAALIAVDIDCNISQGVNLDDVINKLSQAIVEWNIHREYSQQKANCQHFVDSVCDVLGINFNFKGALKEYLVSLRMKGKCKVAWKIPLEIREKFKLQEKKVEFKTHEELDKFVLSLQQIDPLFDEHHPADFQLLKAFDRGFWLRNFKNPNTAAYKPLRDEEDSVKCPFGDPQQSKSLAKEWW